LSRILVFPESAKGTTPFADQNLPVEVQEHHVTDLTLDDLHGGFLPAARAVE